MIDQSWRRWLAPLALALVVLATIVVLAQGGGGSAGGGSGSSAAKPGSGKPAYVRVRSGLCAAMPEVVALPSRMAPLHFSIKRS